MSIKKFAVAAVAVLVGVSSSFATWDYFPPKESGGEAKLNFEFGMPAEKTTTMQLNVGARYTIIPGLEASVILPVPLSSSFDGNSADDYAGLSKPVIGVRYWLPMGLGFFVDAILPVDTRDAYEPDIAFYVGAQYSMNFTDELKFGSELGVVIPTTEGADVDMVIGAEVNYSLGMVTPFLALELTNILVDADMGLGITVGAGFGINDMLGADVYANFGVLDGNGGPDNTPITIGATFSVNF